MQGTDALVFANLIANTVPLIIVQRASIFWRVLLPITFCFVTAIGFFVNHFALGGAVLESIRYGIVSGATIVGAGIVGRRYIRRLYKREN